MKAAKMIYNQILQLTSDLVGTALCNDQNFPVQRGPSWDNCEIEINNINVAAALKNKPYRELFYEMDKARSFNLKLLDGALVQLQYKFLNNSLVGHRLGFFPNPDLIDFQGNRHRSRNVPRLLLLLRRQTDAACSVAGNHGGGAAYVPLLRTQLVHKA